MNPVNTEGMLAGRFALEAPDRYIAKYVTCGVWYIADSLDRPRAEDGEHELLGATVAGMWARSPYKGFGLFRDVGDGYFIRTGCIATGEGSELVPVDRRHITKVSIATLETVESLPIYQLVFPGVKKDVSVNFREYPGIGQVAFAHDGSISGLETDLSWVPDMTEVNGRIRQEHVRTRAWNILMALRETNPEFDTSSFGTIHRLYHRLVGYNTGKLEAAMLGMWVSLCVEAEYSDELLNGYLMHQTDTLPLELQRQYGVAPESSTF